MIRVIAYFDILILATTVASCTFGISPAFNANRVHSTKLAHYKTGIYLAGEGTHLRVNIDKEPGGDLTVQLSDSIGQHYFTQTLKAWETMLRLNLNLTELTDGNYTLKISNGLEVVIREIKIMTIKPTIAPRLITVFNRNHI